MNKEFNPSEQNETPKIYIRNLDKWVEVSQEVYDDHCDYYNVYRTRMKRRGQCSCPRKAWWFCDADCWTCQFRCGSDLSLNEAVRRRDGEVCPLLDTIPNKYALSPDDLADRLMAEFVLDYAHEKDQSVEQAIRLLLEDETISKTKIAELLGLPRMTLVYRMGLFQDRCRNKFFLEK